jgi:hypothetical protein
MTNDPPISSVGMLASGYFANQESIGNYRNIFKDHGTSA